MVAIGANSGLAPGRDRADLAAANASQVISLLPELVAWGVGRHVLNLNPALLMGAVAGARQNTTSMRAAQKESRSAVPGIGYPVPLAITTIALSVVGYFFALFL